MERPLHGLPSLLTPGMGPRTLVSWPEAAGTLPPFPEPVSFLSGTTSWGQGQKREHTPPRGHVGTALQWLKTQFSTALSGSQASRAPHHSRSWPLTKA